MEDSTPFYVFYPSDTEKKSLETGFCILIEFLRANGIDCKIQMLLLNGPLETGIEQILNSAPIRAVYFHIDDITYLSKLSSILTQLAKNRFLIIVGGHSSVTIASRKILEAFDSIDIVVREPENEKNLLDLIFKINSNRGWKSVKGITYRNKGSSSRIVANKDRPLPEKLDHLETKSIIDMGILQQEWYPILVSRGCFYDCQYCISQVPYYKVTANRFQSWRKKSVKKIIDEIEFLVSRGIEKFRFYCDQFFESQQDGIENEFSLSIAAEIIKRNLKVKFKIFTKPREARNNFETILALKKAGLEEIGIGIDSGVKRFHEMYRTGTIIDEVVEVLKFMSTHRIKFSLGFIFYDPYLTFEEIEESIIFLESIAPFFSHLELPYSAYLDSQILNRVLIVLYGMPINRKLRKDNLIVDKLGFPGALAATLKDSRTKTVYNIYSLVNRRFLLKIRHFFYNKDLVKQYNFINLFPLRLLERIFLSVKNRESENLEDYVIDIEIYIKQTFSVYIDRIFSDFAVYRNSDLEKWLKE